MKLKWKNKMFGFVLKHRSLAFGEGEGRRGLGPDGFNLPVFYS
jgi:hypothetical protein